MRRTEEGGTHLAIPFNKGLDPLIRLQDTMYGPVAVCEVKPLRVNDDQRRVLDGGARRSAEEGVDFTESESGCGGHGGGCCGNETRWWFMAGCIVGG